MLRLREMRNLYKTYKLLGSYNIIIYLLYVFKMVTKLLISVILLIIYFNNVRQW